MAKARNIYGVGNPRSRNGRQRLISPLQPVSTGWVPSGVLGFQPSTMGPDEFCGEYVFDPNDLGPGSLPGGFAQVFHRSAVLTAPVLRERASKARAMGQAPVIVRALEIQAQSAPASTADLRQGQVVRVVLPPGISKSRTYADVRVKNTSGPCMFIGPGGEETTPLPGGGESYTSQPVHDPEALRAAQDAYYRLGLELDALAPQITALRAQPQAWANLQVLEARRSSLEAARASILAQFPPPWQPIPLSTSTSPEPMRPIPITGALSGAFYPATGQAAPGSLEEQAKNLLQAASTLEKMIPAYEAQAQAYLTTPQGIYFQNLAQQTRAQLQGVQVQLASVYAAAVAAGLVPAGSPFPQPPPPPSCADLADRIQRAIAMGQAPSIVNALKNMYSQRCLAASVPSSPSPFAPPLFKDAMKGDLGGGTSPGGFVHPPMGTRAVVNVTAGFPPGVTPGLNLRSSPVPGGTVLAALPNGTPFTVEVSNVVEQGRTEANKERWWNVSLNDGRTGFLRAVGPGTPGGPYVWNVAFPGQQTATGQAFYPQW